MNDPFFFGYGSLVNRQTHDYPHATRARVTGWTRSWKGTGLRKVAYLTAIRDETAAIDGLIAAVPGGDWAALDERERAYARHGVDQVTHDHPASPPVQIYAVDPAHAEDGDHPILLSYLDTVIQGYLMEFGEAGAVEFFDTTMGWHLPVHDDRSDPIYPRVTALTLDERGFVDDQLARVREAGLHLTA